MFARTLALALLLVACSDKETHTGETADTGSEHTGHQETGDTSAETGDSSVAEDGASLYATYCESCHGPDGRGTSSGPDITRELHHTDADIIAVILNGRDEMPAILVTEEQAQLIVDYMRATFESGM